MMCEVGAMLTVCFCCSAAGDDGEDDVDPLDAFMAANHRDLVEDEQTGRPEAGA